MWSMFEIRGWTPGTQAQQARFRNYYLGGSRETLEANRPYHLESEVIGSRVSLWIDGVEVAKTLLLDPLRNADRSASGVALVPTLRSKTSQCEVRSPVCL
jgi:hypothetical protein